MAKASVKLTVDQQLLVSSVANEITDTTSIHQQAIVRMLAVASEHKLNAANLIEDLSVEIKSNTARKIPFVVHDLKAGLSIQQAFARTPGIVPESTVLALEAADSRGLQNPLNHALLKTTNKCEAETVGAENLEAVDHVSKLLQKYIFVIAILSFMMLFLVPQFKSMYGEFGIELPISMQLLVTVSNIVVKLWFVFAFILMAVTVFFIWRHPRVFTNYFTRWIPSRWQQPVLTKRAQQDLSVAWVVQTSGDLPETAKQFIHRNGVDAEELNRISDAGKAGPGGGILQAFASKRVISKRASTAASAASSNESAAWILRKMSQQSQQNRRQRSLAGLRTVIWIGNFFLLFLAGWTAIAIFQSLIFIIRGLTG